MKFTLSWLKDFLDTDAPLDSIVETLTRVGLEVEEVVNPADALRDFVVVDVLEAEPHPDADKLRVCQVTDGSEILQIVCGAPNARKGMKAVLGKAGTYVPGADITLRKSKIRGVESNGMMCSASELNLGDDHDGILDLPDDAVAGQSYADYAALDDPMIEIAITPNRQDCLGVYGIARDLAAAGLGPLKPYVVPTIEESFDTDTKTEISEDALQSGACSAFFGRSFRNVKNGESPDWLKQRLTSVGQQPISALVDITNYFSISFARPLHVYDADKVGPVLTARVATPGESVETLDAKTYETQGGETLIADAAGPQGFAGVIGGLASGVSETTTRVFLECALFDPIITAMTGRKHQIETDARYRFERGVDPVFAEDALAMASQMVLDLCGGEAGKAQQAGAASWDKAPLTLRPSRVERLGGVAVSVDQMTSILTSLGFGVSGSDPLTVTIPSWRVDIEGEADLVEEVLRIYGYDDVPSVTLPARGNSFAPSLPQDTLKTRAARRLLAKRGLNEVVTWSFLSEDPAKLFGGGGDDIRVDNPISALLSHMRPSALPNLLDAAARNEDRGADSISLFEVGPAYENDTPEGQKLIAAGVRTGTVAPRHWAGDAREVDVFDAKADCLALLEELGAPIANLQVMDGAGDVFHPGRSGTLRLGPKAILARFGEFHPRVLQTMDVDGRSVGFEVYLDALPARRKTISRGALEVSNLQSVTRDFAFLMPRSTDVQPLIRAVKGADKAHITEIGIFDVYEGKGISEDEKSVGLYVRLEPQSETFSDTEIDAISAKIVAAAEKAVGARLRA